MLAVVVGGFYKVFLSASQVCSILFFLGVGTFTSCPTQVPHLSNTDVLLSGEPWLIQCVDDDGKDELSMLETLCHLFCFKMS